MGGRVGERSGEGAGVAETKVQTLAGERVNGVGGVAGEGDARGDVGGRLAEAEGERCEGVGLDGCYEREG